MMELSYSSVVRDNFFSVTILALLLKLAAEYVYTRVFKEALLVVPMVASWTAMLIVLTLGTSMLTGTIAVTNDSTQPHLTISHSLPAL